MSTLLFASLFAGCGGDRQDTAESSGEWPVVVEKWEFPTEQRLGKRYRMKMAVRNLGDSTIPNLTVTLGGLTDLTTLRGAADAKRDVWIRDRPKPGSKTAGQDVYEFGSIEAGKTGEWWIDLTPVRRGRRTVTYALSGGLYGDAKVTYEDGTPATGQREIFINPNFDIEEDTLN
jgi:hypothetical protein